MEQREQRLKDIEQQLREELGDATQELADLDAQVRQYGEDGEIAEGADNHPGDDSDRLYEQERLLTIRSRLAERKGDIEHALGKFDEGTYGVCERCGQRIETARLEALPFARYCRECQEILDQQEAATT